MRWNDTEEYFPPPYLDYNAVNKESKSVMVTIWRPYIEKESIEIAKYVDTINGNGWASEDGKLYDKHEIVKAWAWLPNPYKKGYFGREIEWEQE